MFFLSWLDLRDACCQTLEFLQGQSKRVAQRLALLFRQLLEFGAYLPQSSVGPMSDGRDHLQVTQQFLKRGGHCGLRFPLHLQKQLWLFEETLSDLGRRLAPSGIQLPGLPTGELVPREGHRHLLAVFQTGTRHRHQILHGHLRRELARSYLLLHAVRQKLDQRQAT
jgi:hypothetical protein